MLMNKQNYPVLRTKNVDQVPFKNELYSKDASWTLIYAAGNKKTYRQFVRDCDRPELLLEVLKLKYKDPHFPSLKKIHRIAFFAAFAGVLTSIIKGRKAAAEIQCTVYRYFMPKKQYDNVG